MAHNPIKSVQKVGRLNNYTAENGTCGVVYEGVKSLNRVLNAGESVSAGLKELKVYVVDMRPHQMTWQGSLNARGEEESDYFPFSVMIKYKVVDAARMVVDGVEDTEALISDALREGLTDKISEYAIHQQKTAERRIREEVLNIELREGYGLERVGAPEVKINLLTPQKERVKQLRRPHSQEHKIDLPCKNPHLHFQVKVNVTYRVEDEEKLFGTLEEAEEQFWRQKIERALRDISQKYEQDQLGEADNAMQSKLNQMFPLTDYGLTVSAVNIETEPDEIARKRDLELEDLVHQKKVNDIKRELTAADTYALLELSRMGGKWAMLSEAVRRGEMTVSQMVSQLDQDERTKLEQKIGIIKTFRDDNTKFDVVENKIVEAIGNELAATVAASYQSAPQLSQGGSARQLPKGSDSGETEKR